MSAGRVMRAWAATTSSSPSLSFPSSSSRTSTSSLSSSNTRSTRVNSFDKDLGSVLFAVLSFLSIGLVLFSLCFCVTKALQCYKAHKRRKRRRDIGEEPSQEELEEEEEEEADEEEEDEMDEGEWNSRVMAGGVEMGADEQRRLMRGQQPKTDSRGHPG